MSENKQEQKSKIATAIQVAKAVMSAFMGIRKKSDLENDAANLKPSQLIIGGIIGAMIFVVSILLLVNTIVD
ncbi:MAG: DUF2970 domain-containing protein [Burkholderiales bacterium]|nr:DUF2970 domain-containing protein [Nitrosomonas sp.]MCP5275853.1 DUF2970 domain-containing protein [Burkholderiales bacterium]